jgi:hypothetical protein
MKLSYFPNEKGDFTLTINDEPAGIVFDEEHAKLFCGMRFIGKRNAPSYQSLNKQNFWNDLHEQFPKSVDMFCKWIDDYKKGVQWDHMFRRQTYTDHQSETSTILDFRIAKFHDLPIAMQIGIIFQFTVEVSHAERISLFYGECDSISDAIDRIVIWFETVHKELVESENKMNLNDGED